jgi:predicted lipid-binding transport protein (Tim44 family)
MRNPFRKSLPLRVLLGVLALLAYVSPSSAVLGVRRRTAVVAYSAGSAHAASAAQASAAQASAAQQSAAAQQQAAAAQQSAAASAAAASQAAAAATAATKSPAKTPQEKLTDLQSLYKQGLITESEYQASRAKILKEME